MKFIEFLLVGTAALSIAKLTVEIKETADKPFEPINADQFIITTSTASSAADDVDGVFVRPNLRRFSGPDYVFVRLTNPDSGPLIVNTIRSTRFGIRPGEDEEIGRRAGRDDESHSVNLTAPAITVSYM